MGASGLIAVGSGPAGLNAASAFRARHPRVPVTILTADPAMPYAKPPLSKEFLCGRRSDVDLRSADWFAERRIDLIRGITVEHLDVENRDVITRGGRRYSYWHCVLACGSKPVPLDVPGAEYALHLRSLADAVALRMAALSAETAVVVGGGLIGCEAAACLAADGMATTLIAGEPVPLLRRFGLDAGERIAKILSDNGVRFIGNASVAEIDERGVNLATGEAVDGDVVLAATGVRPDIELAVRAGLRTDHGRILTDEHLHTSAPGVYAAGDVALARHAGARRRVPAEHWRDAARQGTIAGNAAAGYPSSWRDVPEYCCTIGTSTLKYRGWGASYEHSRLVDHRDGFTVWYEFGGELVGVLGLNADDDFRQAAALVRDHAPFSPDV